MYNLNFFVKIQRNRIAKAIRSAIALSFLLVLVNPLISLAADFAGKLKEVTITDQSKVDIPPTASITYTRNGDTFNFDASGSVDTDGSIVEYSWDFGDGVKGNGATVTHQFLSSDKHVVTLVVRDNSGGIALSQVMTPEIFIKAVSFQPLYSPVETGFVVDDGKAYNATLGYGWVVLPGKATIDRDSPNSPSQSYDTFIKVLPSGVWELSLPNGNYSVTICMGDPAWPSGTQSVQVENIPLVENVLINSATPWVERSKSIEITDGRLTLTFTGSSPYASMCWVKVQSK